MGDNSDYPAAVLTNAQRAYLRGERDYSPAEERDIRARIRQRVRAAYADFELLHENLTAEDRGQTADSFTWGDLVAGLRAATAFTYQLGDESSEPLDVERVMQDGILEGKQGRVNVLQERLEDNPEDLTLSELETLQEAGALDRATHRDLLEERLDLGGFFEPMGEVKKTDDEADDDADQ